MLRHLRRREQLEGVRNLHWVIAQAAELLAVGAGGCQPRVSVRVHVHGCPKRCATWEKRRGSLSSLFVTRFAGAGS